MANGDTTETAYDSMGQVKSRTTGNGYTTKYEHDALGLLTETIDPLERKTVNKYDAVGNLKETEDALGRTIACTYDKANRLTKIDYSEAGTADITYEYDKDGNVTKMVDGTGTTTRVYDQLGRLTEVKNGAKEVVKYKYDLGNQQTEIVYPNGEAVKRAFDKAGRLEKVTDWLGKETTFAYNRDSQLRATTFPATTSNVDEYAYNRVGQLTEVSMKKKAEVLASMAYTRDKIGQIEKAVEAGFPKVPEYKYEYDARNRLTKSNGTLFEYDKANNVTKIAPTTYTYDKADQIATASTGTFEYNKVGQRIKETPTGGSATTFFYDQAGNLVASKGPEIENTFQYDGTGLRTKETKNTTTYPMAWDPTPELPLLLRAGNDYFIYGPDSLPLEQITSGSTTYLHHDQLGSTRVLTGSTGTATGTYTYGPNGAFWEHTGTGATLMGFAGQRRMRAENQLIYLRARTYDPVTAQFLSVDPAVQETGEPYSYAGGNPTNRGDPSGLDTWGNCGVISLSLPIFLQGEFSVCNVFDENGNAAWTFTFGGGSELNSNTIQAIGKWLESGISKGDLLKRISGSATYGRQWSNARSIEELKGTFRYVQASTSLGLPFGIKPGVSVNVQRFWGPKVSGCTMGGGFSAGTGGWGGGAGSGGSYTWIVGRSRVSGDPCDGFRSVLTSAVRSNCW
jgi:RHS repeat-associated protein